MSWEKLEGPVWSGMAPEYAETVFKDHSMALKKTSRAFCPVRAWLLGGLPQWGLRLCMKHARVAKTNHFVLLILR